MKETENTQKQKRNKQRRQHSHTNKQIHHNARTHDTQHEKQTHTTTNHHTTPIHKNNTNTHLNKRKRILHGGTIIQMIRWRTRTNKSKTNTNEVGWAGKLAQQGYKWSGTATLWEPLVHSSCKRGRSQARPCKRWRDDLDAFLRNHADAVAPGWHANAKETHKWRALSEEFVSHWCLSSSWS